MTLETYINQIIPYFGGFIGIMVIAALFNAHNFWRMKRELEKIRELMEEGKKL